MTGELRSVKPSPVHFAACRAVLVDRELLVRPAPQRTTLGHALNLRSNQVTVEVRRMGGGFGGKESQSALFACVAAIAAKRLQRPVK